MQYKKEWHPQVHTPPLFGPHDIRNFCRDENIPLRLLYTAMPGEAGEPGTAEKNPLENTSESKPVGEANGAAGPCRVNIYEVKSDDLIGQKGNANSAQQLVRGEASMTHDS